MTAVRVREKERARRCPCLRSSTVAEEPHRPRERTSLDRVRRHLCVHGGSLAASPAIGVVGPTTKVGARLEIIVCVDHNDSPLGAVPTAMGATRPDGPSIPVVVLANKYEGRLGSARNSAAEVARGDIVAFLDDDAWADPDWLDRLLLALRERVRRRRGWSADTGVRGSATWLVSVRIRLGLRMRLFRASRDSRHRSLDSSEPTCRCGDWPSRRSVVSTPTTMTTWTCAIA